MTAPAARTRRRGFLAASFAALCLIATGLATPAWADLYEDNGGPPGSHDYHATLPVTPGYTWTCDKEGNEWRHGPFGSVIIEDGPSPACSGGHAGVNFRLCQPAVQVFRFYGTMRKPVIGWSTSMLAQEKWCSPKPAYMWSTSAYDVNNHLDLDNYDRQSVGGNPTPDLGLKPDVTTENARGLSIDPMYALSWALPAAPQRVTTGRPFAGNEKCAAAQSPTNPFRDMLDDPKADPDVKAKMVASLIKGYDDEVQNIIDTYQVGIIAAKLAAKKETGLASIDRVAGTVEFIDNDCASAMQYVSTVSGDQLGSAAARGRYRVTGTCYIPLERLGRQYDMPDGTGQVGFPSLVNGYSGGGTRYSDYYAGQQYTKGNGDDNQVDGLKNTYERSILRAWRSQMLNWYDHATTGAASSLYLHKPQQVLPADPYPTMMNADGERVPNVPATQNMPYFTKSRALHALEYFSKCRFGPQAQFVNGRVRNTLPNPQANLVVENQAVQQSGGYAAPDQGFTVVDKGLTCDDSSLCNGHDIVLEKLLYRVRVTFPDGWDVTESEHDGTAADAQLWVADEGGTQTALTCSGNVCTALVQATSSGSHVSFGARYFKPTMPDQQVNVAVSNVAATFRKTITYTYWVTATDSDGNEYQSEQTEDVIRHVTLGNVNVSGDPVRMDPDTHSYAMKVIGAISAG